MKSRRRPPQSQRPRSKKSRAVDTATETPAPAAAPQASDDEVEVEEERDAEAKESKSAPSRRSSSTTFRPRKAAKEASPPAAKEPAQTSAAALEADEKSARKVRRVIKSYYSQPLNSRENDPWECMHGMLAYGVHSQIRQGGPQGKPITLVGWLCYNRPCKGFTLLYTDAGKRTPRQARRRPARSHGPVPGDARPMPGLARLPDPRPRSRVHDQRLDRSRKEDLLPEDRS